MKKIICYLTALLLCVSVVGLRSFAENDSPVTVKAKAYVLMDASTGEVLLKSNEHQQLFPASVTKIMPILLVMEAIDSGKLDLNEPVTASPEAAAKGGSQIWLKDGETMTVNELLKATVIGSANDACTALGERIAGSEEGIVKMMNDRAKELGMNDTHFVNCTGLDDDTDEHLTSAYDIALMSKQLLSHERIREYSTVWMDSLRDGATQLVNTNKLVRFYKGTTGLKTGTTAKAGYCVSASAERSGLHLIAVVMGSDNSTDRFEGAKALLNYGFANFKTVTPEYDKMLITPVRVIKGYSSSLIPEVAGILPVTVKAGEENQIEAEIQLATDVEAPVEKGQTLGRIIFRLNGETLAQYPLTAKEEIKRLTVSQVMRRLLSALSVRAQTE